MTIEEIHTRAHKCTPAKADKDIAREMNTQVEARPAIGERP
jgi:hypothetical protein